MSSQRLDEEVKDPGVLTHVMESSGINALLQPGEGAPLPKFPLHPDASVPLHGAEAEWLIEAPPVQKVPSGDSPGPTLAEAQIRQAASIPLPHTSSHLEPHLQIDFPIGLHNIRVLQKHIFPDSCFSMAEMGSAAHLGPGAFKADTDGREQFIVRVFRPSPEMTYDSMSAIKDSITAACRAGGAGLLVPYEFGLSQSPPVAYWAYQFEEFHTTAHVLHRLRQLSFSSNCQSTILVRWTYMIAASVLHLTCIHGRLAFPRSLIWRKCHGIYHPVIWDVGIPADDGYAQVTLNGRLDRDDGPEISDGRGLMLLLVYVFSRGEERPQLNRRSVSDKLRCLGLQSLVDLILSADVDGVVSELAVHQARFVLNVTSFRQRYEKTLSSKLRDCIPPGHDWEMFFSTRLGVDPQERSFFASLVALSGNNLGDLALIIFDLFEHDRDAQLVLCNALRNLG